MGHRFNWVDSLFEDVTYNIKTSAELRPALEAKVVALRAKAIERDARMMAVRDEYGIDAEWLAVLVMRHQNGNKSSVSFEPRDGEKLIPAGIIANLVEERSMIDNEQEQVAKIELVLRNLRDEVQFRVEGTGEIKTAPSEHQLTDNELLYLGF